MAQQVGYISSFLEPEGLGFIRCADDPQRVLLFHRSALGDEAADHITEGLEVTFELAPTTSADGWEVVSSVNLHVVTPGDGEDEDPGAGDEPHAGIDADRPANPAG